MTATNGTTLWPTYIDLRARARARALLMGEKYDEKGGKKRRGGEKKVKKNEN